VDGTTEVSPASTIAVSFTKPADPTSLTVASDTSCTATLQLSSDGFATCVPLGPPASSSGGQIFTSAPLAPLAPRATYKLRVTTGVKDATGVALANPFTSALGFSIAAGFQVAQTNPVDGATGIAGGTPITVTFTQPATPSSITTTLSTAACTGTLQVSSDAFVTCVPMAGAPVPGNSNQSFTVTPAEVLASGTTYAIRVTTGAQDATGNPLPTTYTSATGFTTDVGPFAVAQTSPVDGATHVALTSGTVPVVLTFTRAATPSSLTSITSPGADGGAPACGGTLQLSSDNFATCVQMKGAPAPSPGNRTFTVIPQLLASGTSYKIRVTVGAKDAGGAALLQAFTTPTGFSTM
jgi:hypothetical protein